MHRLKFILLLGVVFATIGCKQEKDPNVAAFEVYVEMVVNGAKPVALSPPMSSTDIDTYWEEWEKHADQMGVTLFRERDFPVTLLFPAVTTYEKEVVVIYKDPVRFQQYLQFKMDDQDMEAYEAARRLGRLLGYSTEGVNDLLMKNTAFRSLKSFEVGRQITHFYYQDVASAREFYQSAIGLNEVEENLFMISPDAYLALHPYDEMHTADDPKSTAIALLTDQLPQWYQHIRQQQIPIRFAYKARKGNAHDGFVAEDPEGYLLEFEQFKQHPENERFFAILEKAPRVQTSNYPLNFHGSISWTYHIDLVKMQKYYDEVLGFPLVADQGWTKIYQTSPTGFIGLVDECRGMEDYAERKNVEIEWQFDRSEALYEYLESNQQGWDANNQLVIGPENYYYRLR